VSVGNCPDQQTLKGNAVHGPDQSRNSRQVLCHPPSTLLSCQLFPSVDPPSLNHRQKMRPAPRRKCGSELLGAVPGWRARAVAKPQPAATVAAGSAVHLIRSLHFVDRRERGVADYPEGTGRPFSGYRQPLVFNFEKQGRRCASSGRGLADDEQRGPRRGAFVPTGVLKSPGGCPALRVGATGPVITGAGENLQGNPPAYWVCCRAPFNPAFGAAIKSSPCLPRWKRWPPSPRGNSNPYIALQKLVINAPVRGR
jgi:hypothetical protein